MRRPSSLILRSSVGIAFGLNVLGCSPSPSGPPAVSVQPVLKSDPLPALPLDAPSGPSANPAAPAESAPVAAKPVLPPAAPFAFPTDLGGKKLASALTPSTVPSPTIPTTAKPRERFSEIDRGELALPKTSMAIPTIPQSVGKPARLSPPAERLPSEIGTAVAHDPTAVRLPEGAGVRGKPAPTLGAGDLPPLARQLPDRASLEDPTSDLSSLRVVVTPWPSVFLPDSYLRFSIPDPYEFVDQMRGKTGLDRELGTTPAVVPPMR